ncbi:MAG: hypothetical protein HY561_08085 [Gemmatimonadetes bacterium]|nr:hypothetical protein [Gemmatimonadota bacterium]
MSSDSRFTASSPPLVVDLLELVPHPKALFPVLFRRAEREAAPELFFSALSGIFVAYIGAKWLALGDRVGFAPATVGVLLLGGVLGFLALYFAGGLLSWSADALGGEGDTERMYAVFGYSTWLFLPLLAIVIPTELAFYGSALFSADRPQAPGLVVWGIRGLELATILTWSVLLVKGTGAAAGFMDVKAAETIAISLLELGGIALLILLILLVSLLAW